MSSAPEIIIPIAIELDWPAVETTVREILEQYEKFGFSSFLLAAPCGGWRSVGYPPASHWDDRARYFAQVRAQLPPAIRCGWWITATLKSGRMEGALPLTKSDGTESAMANCPLDPVFRERFSADVARFAAIAKPDFIMTEDDYSVNAGSDANGCFCAHHLAEFSRRTGRVWTRETLAAALAEGDDALERAWRTLKKDSLVLLAEDLRRALDEKTPEIPMGYMQAGSAYREDNCVYEVAKAMAGPNHTPFSRIFGTFYSGVTGREIPSTVYRCLWARQHVPEPFGFIHESDTYPHTRFFSSGSAMRAILSTVYSMGFRGSTFQTQQLLDDPNEQSAVYGNMVRRERPRFETVCRIAEQCRVYGAQVAFDPFWNNRTLKNGTSKPLWCNAVSRMGIPYTTTDSTVRFWDEVQGAHASDEEVMQALSGGLILDGAAAKALCTRGYGKYLGVSVGENAAPGKAGLDLGAREIVRDGFCSGMKGRNMPAAHMYAPGGNGVLLALTVTDETCEVITEQYTFQKKYVCTAMTRFVNSLGGRVAVMGETLEGNRSQSLFNHRRQRILQELVLWCGGDFAMAMGTADIFVVENRAKDENADFYGMLTLVNLGDDTPEPFEVHLPAAWRGGSVLVMTPDGGWKEADCTALPEGILLREPAARYSPVYLLFRKNPA